MSSILTAVPRRRRLALASTFLVPVIFLNASVAKAQQSASPNLLPTVEVVAPTDRQKLQPTPPANRASRSRRVVRAPAQQTPAAAPQSGTAVAAPVVVSPTGTVTPTSQVASSITVITAKDIETQQ